MFKRDANSIGPKIWDLVCGADRLDVIKSCLCVAAYYGVELHQLPRVRIHQLLDEAFVKVAEFAAQLDADEAEFDEEFRREEFGEE